MNDYLDKLIKSKSKEFQELFKIGTTVLECGYCGKITIINKLVDNAEEHFNHISSCREKTLANAKEYIKDDGQNDKKETNSCHRLKQDQAAYRTMIKERFKLKDRYHDITLERERIYTEAIELDKIIEKHKEEMLKNIFGE